MKKTTIFAAVAATGAFALAMPDWNHSLNAAPYANPKYEISNAVVTEQLAVAGCKTLKKVVKGDVTLFEDGSYAMYRYDWPTAPTTLTGSWALVASKSTNTIYLSINNASMGSLFSGLDADGLANCKVKYPAMTYVSIVEPSVLIKKNAIVVKIKNQAATGTLQLTGKQQNDSKGAPVTGNVSAKITLKGLFTTLIP